MFGRKLHFIKTPSKTLLKNTKTSPRHIEDDKTLDPCAFKMKLNSILSKNIKSENVFPF